MISLTELAKKIKNRLVKRNIELKFFIFSGAGLPLPSNLRIEVIDTEEAFRRSDTVPKALKTEAYFARLRQKDRFVCLTDGEKALSWGWVFAGRAFYLFEIDRTSCHDDNTFVYDFFTPEPYRNRGYYATLLAHLPARIGENRVTVGADRENLASIRGIEKAGYIPYDMKFCE